MFTADVKVPTCGCTPSSVIQVSGSFGGVPTVWKYTRRAMR